VEVEVVANPFTGFNIMTGFARNDSKYTKAESDVQGLRPSTATSPTAANLWMSYKLSKGAVRGLGFGFGGIYASDNKVLNSRSVGTFILPAYTILNSTVFYETPTVRAGVKVDNMTNQKYWIGYSSMVPQKLRSVTASVSFKF
jgi:iron complex outermembrane receptor protein